MTEADPHARTSLAERYGRMLRSRLGSRTIEVACAQEDSADGEAKAAWRMIVEVLKRH